MSNQVTETRCIRSGKSARGDRVPLLFDAKAVPHSLGRYSLFQGRCEDVFPLLSSRPTFDLVLTSPPYNIGKVYERKTDLPRYLETQSRVIEACVRRLKPNGSLCWQVGNYVENGFIEPIDLHLHHIFASLGLKLRNRIIWRYGHGLHCKRRFSGRYEVVLWYTLTDTYYFDLDSVRIPQKYPGKRAYAGPNQGKLSSNPKGKNPEDVWDIPNVVGNHVEKTGHPCQFPVGLAERLVTALSPPRALIFDPFAGVATTGVACALHSRDFLGAEIDGNYARKGRERIADALAGKLRYRPHDRPVFDHKLSPLSQSSWNLH